MQICKPMFGIVGGMGPLSSAQFIYSIYLDSLSTNKTEQDHPRIILISDPCIPDRSRALKSGKVKEVVAMMNAMILGLIEMGAEEVFIACITAHGFLDQLDHSVKKHVTSILDLLYWRLGKLEDPALLLSSLAAKKHHIVRHHQVKYLMEDDASMINNIIFNIKQECNEKNYNQYINLISLLAQKYEAENLIFACTELHLLNTFIKRNQITLPYQILDPLELAAEYIINKKIINKAA